MAPEPENPEIGGWDHLDAGCTADNFCTADDNRATCGARIVEEIVEKATCEAADDCSDDGDDIEERGDERLPPPAAETLHALDILKHAMGAEEIREDPCTHFYASERSLLTDLTKKKQQMDIRGFFCKI